MPKMCEFSTLIMATTSQDARYRGIRFREGSEFVQQCDYLRSISMTILHHKNILATAALVVFATFNFASTASAQQGRCDLTVKGSGRHSCQCETLVNHRADWQIGRAHV